ncbi:hypothetical protein B0H10DRAFT_1970404 [Mycena sp. CBHHK59/15]|nr:hypothetical protein B0H10DRAFT_1970404 [Mycena sp. CBHHK59/15]
MHAHTVSEHVKSPVLFKTTANQLSAAASSRTSSVRSSGSSATDQDLRDSMPAYRKVGTFLVKVLAKELQARRKAPEFIHHKSRNEILAAFKTQFESYTRQYPPFSALQKTWSRPMQYWKAMSQLPEASVLAFVGMKIFSILPNSMAEERTVSRFTRNDTVDRTRQDASTIVAMTKIYQHNQRVEAASTPKSPKKSKAPTLNWRSVRGLMKEADRTVAATPTTTVTNSETAPTVMITPACEAGLAAVNLVEADDATSSTLPQFTDTTISSRRDGVDIRLPFFHDVLSDKPIPGANEIRSLADWSERATGSTEAGKKAAGDLTWEGEVETLVF